MLSRSDSSVIILGKSQFRVTRDFIVARISPRLRKSTVSSCLFRWQGTIGRYNVARGTMLHQQNVAPRDPPGRARSGSSFSENLILAGVFLHKLQMKQRSMYSIEVLSMQWFIITTFHPRTDNATTWHTYSDIIHFDIIQTTEHLIDMNKLKKKRHILLSTSSSLSTAILASYLTADFDRNVHAEWKTSLKSSVYPLSQS